MKKVISKFLIIGIILFSVGNKSYASDCDTMEGAIETIVVVYYQPSFGDICRFKFGVKFIKGIENTKYLERLLKTRHPTLTRKQ
ncbi:MAG: hypothetical protein JJW01_02685 [Alphaproteobacteria bacterium]|nr:hypothetical protein [Rickettsiales bacterium]